MSKLKSPISFETTFNVYSADELIGEGGSGRVFAGTASDGSRIAIKVLAEERASKEKRSRFKNELGFQSRNKHRNIVTVIDHGVIRDSAAAGPFYVMPRYESNLRELIKAGIHPEEMMSIFSQLLDGVEAAHLLGVSHRDLKPENILYSPQSRTLAIADFGAAHFTDDLMVTQVETKPAQRLANFMYAAPEQRTAGKYDGRTADIYALGLMLNEMCTGAVPHGTNFRLIRQAIPKYGYLDPIVERMLAQDPGQRLPTVESIKNMIRKVEYEAVTQQRISQINETVIKAGEIDDPLAITPPKLVDANWNRGSLTLILDRPVHQAWINAFYNMGHYTSVMGKDPGRFRFQGNEAYIDAQEHQVQHVVDFFKDWLPNATQTLRNIMEQEAQRKEREQRERLRLEREEEERRLRVMRQIKI